MKIAYWLTDEKGIADMDSGEIYRQIFSTIKKGTIEETIRTGYQIIGFPIVLMDAACLVMGKYPLESEPGTVHWNAYMPGRQVDPQLIRAAWAEGHIGILESSEAPILIDWGFAEREPRITEELRWQGKPIGYLLVLCREKSYEQWQIDAIHVLGEALTMLLAIQGQRRQVDETFANTLFYGLLSGEMESDEEIGAVLAASQINLKPHYLLIVAEQRRRGDQPMREYLATRWEQHYLNALIYVYNQSLYILLYDLKEDYREHEQYHQAMALLKEMDAVCGISRTFDSIYRLREYRWQADRALESGRLMRPRKTIHHYADYVLDIIICQLVQSINAESFIHPALAILEKHDRMHGSEYLETLKAYLVSQFDVTKTLEALHIHRNTLWYRLGKIKAMTGIDLHDGQSVEHLFLSFRYRDLAARVNLKSGGT